MRRFTWRFSAKKIVLVVFVCSTMAYLVSVWGQSKASARNVWSVTGLQNTTDGLCGPPCPANQLSFYIKTGLENKIGPTICFEQQVIMSEGKGNVKRGMNVVIINEKTHLITTKHVYDTYLDEHEFVQDMKAVVKEGNIVMIASYDEIADSLKEGGRVWLKLFGSELVTSLAFRDSFILIGQKGLQQGHAIEFKESKGSDKFATPIEKAGCFSLPLGRVQSVQELLPKLVKHGDVPVGIPVTNCGLKEICKPGTFPVAVDTGKESTKYPEVCVNGNQVLAKDVNSAGRGMNIVIVDPDVGEAKAVSRFDTYEKDSAAMELFLDSLAPRDIIIAIAFDDSARKLSYHARELFNQLGSGMAQNIKFRDVWYFIGQKGIDGFTNMEKLSYAGMDAEWPEPLSGKFCVSSKLVGSPIVPDPPAHRNDVRREFCKKNDGYGDFCDPSHVDDPSIKPVKLVDDTLQNNPVYSSPIVIVPGLNHNALVRTMETTVMQPGVQLHNVLVTWDEKFPEHAELADLFGFRNLSVSGSTSYTDHMTKSIEEAAQIYKDSDYMIVLEEELLVSPDFLYFLSQCNNLLHRDPTLLGVSAFNFNGFDTMSDNKSIVYRVEDIPGLAFMLKMSVYTELIEGRKACCGTRSWDGWTLSGMKPTPHMLVPDVSRAYRQAYDGSGPDEEYLVRLFNRPRTTNSDRGAKLLDLDNLYKLKYDQLVNRAISTAKPLNASHVTKCVKTNGKVPLDFPTKNSHYSLFYKQASTQDFSGLMKLAKCFGFVALENHKPKHMYQGVLRFTYKNNNMFLVGSKSEFAKHHQARTNYMIV